MSDPQQGSAMTQPPVLRMQTGAVHPRLGLPPVIRAHRCGPQMQRKIAAAFELARTWARGALGAVDALRHGAARARWNAGPLRASFGRFQIKHARVVLRLWRGVVARFEHGFDHGGRRRAVVIECFPESHERCGEGLLGNANLFGRLRLCPQLLARSERAIAAVLLHEMMHQGLGVDDVRHSSCIPDRKQRCYRENADRLVRQGHDALAVRNIDNHVRFAMRLHGGGRAGTR